MGLHQREGRGRRGAVPNQERDVGDHCQLESIVQTCANVLTYIFEGNPVFSLYYRENMSWLSGRLMLGGCSSAVTRNNTTIYFSMMFRKQGTKHLRKARNQV